MSPEQIRNMVLALAQRAECLAQLRVYRVKLEIAINNHDDIRIAHYESMIRINSTQLENIYELLTGVEEWDSQ